MKKISYLLSLAVYSFILLLIGLPFTSRVGSFEEASAYYKSLMSVLLIMLVISLALSIFILIRFFMVIRGDYTCIKNAVEKLNIDYSDLGIYRSMKLNGFAAGMKLAMQLKSDTNLFGEDKYSLYVTRGTHQGKLAYWITIFGYWDGKHEYPIMITLDGDIYWKLNKNLKEFEPKQYICVGLGYECNIPIYICHREYFQQIGIKELEELEI